jgi:hypothetical protein
VQIIPVGAHCERHANEQATDQNGGYLRGDVDRR